MKMSIFQGSEIVLPRLELGATYSIERPRPPLTKGPGFWEERSVLITKVLPHEHGYEAMLLDTRERIRIRALHRANPPGRSSAPQICSLCVMAGRCKHTSILS